MAKKKVVQKHTKQRTKSPLKAPQGGLRGLSKPQEYMEFISFMALPRVLRGQILEVRTQDDFALKYGVNRNTLVAWKKRIGFWNEVQNVRKDFFRERSGDILLALESTCLREGKGSDVKVLLTYTGEYNEKLEQEHKISPELKKALDKLDRVLV